MRRWLSAGVLLLLLSAAVESAEESEPLDAEFLEYLAQLEGDDDDWTLVVAAEESPAPPGKDLDSKAPKKTSKQEDRPAADER
jgi:hypothetical protein